VSVYHCPICPLIFEFRTEVEWHLRNEHRSRSAEDAELRVEIAAASGELTQDRLRVLQSSYSRPSVTLLMATTPSPTMSSLDVARLRHLAHLARRRLDCEAQTGTTTSVEHRLARAVSAAEGTATDNGVAVLVNAHQLAIFALPFAPRDRAAIDSRFATRDLEYKLQHYPPYRVVVLGTSPRILEGSDRHLTDTAPNPVEGRALLDDDQRGLGRRSIRPERWLARRARHAAGCAEAEHVLDRRLRATGTMPLIVVGDNRWRSEFHRHSGHVPQIIGEIDGSHTRASTAKLAELVQPTLAAHHLAEQAGQIAELQQADAHGTLTWGLANAWRALRDGSTDAVWIEHGYAQPGRRAPDSDSFETTDDSAQPGVVDDLVDDVIQLAAGRGVTVVFVDDGVLTRKKEPIAARIPVTQGLGGSAQSPDDAAHGHAEVGELSLLSAAGSP
jgi:hypothetical protein